MIAQRSSATFTFATVLLCFFASFADHCVNIRDNVNDGYRMISSVFKIIHGLPIFSCVTECMVVSKCKSINYRNRSRTCGLNMEDSVGKPSDVHPDVDFFHSDIGKWPRTLAGPCENVLCADGSKCVTNRWNAATCITDADQGCGDPSDLANAVMSLNGHYQGAVTSYTCDIDFLFCGTSTFQICTASGQWEGLDGTCGRAYWENPSLPMSEPLPCEMTEKYKIVVQATPIGENRIKTTLRIGSQVGIQFDMRFNYLGEVRTSVFASNINNVWINERNTYFPFTVGVPYKVELFREDGKYKVFLNDVAYGELEDRSPDRHPDRLIIDNDVQVHNVTFTQI